MISTVLTKPGSVFEPACSETKPTTSTPLVCKPCNVQRSPKPLWQILRWIAVALVGVALRGYPSATSQHRGGQVGSCMK